MDKPFPAYRGSDSYVFICYAHKDSESVYADLAVLRERSINIWYDEGIEAGSSWRESIAGAIKNADKLIFYVSANSLKSAHCLREVDYALNNDIDIIPVYLDSSALPGELELALNRVQALFRGRDSFYIDHLSEAIRGTVQLSPLGRSARKRRSFLPWVSLVFVLGAIALWVQRDALVSSVQSGSLSNAVRTPSAFDSYQQGMQLIGRWDKDDNLNQAITLFEQAIALDDSFALAHSRLAEALRIRYRLSNDSEFLEQARANTDQALRLNPDLAPVQTASGRILFMQGNIDLASAAFERALAIDPFDAEANEAMAIMRQYQGRLEDAEQLFNKAITLGPENLQTLDGYANFLFAQSRFAEAVEQWQTVIRLAPDHYAALVNLGSALSGMGNVAESVSMYLRAIEIRPTYMAYSNLGTAYSAAGRYPEAIEAYREALALKDSDWLAWGNLGFILSWEQGLSEETLSTFDRAIELAEAARTKNPRNPWANSDLALYYAKTGNPEFARQRAETALALSPETSELLVAAAETFEILGERGRALELVEQALALGFPNAQLQRNRELADLLTTR